MDQIIVADIIPGTYEFRSPSNKAQYDFPLFEALKPVKYMPINFYKIELRKHSISNRF